MIERFQKAIMTRVAHASSLSRPVLIFITSLLLASCGGGGGSGPALPPPPPPPPPAAFVDVTGVLSYEFPPPAAGCMGLDFAAVQDRPIRRATVQLLNAAGDTIIDSVMSGDDGSYAFQVNAATDYVLRVRAELKSTRWDVEVRDNVDPANTLPLAQRPLYVLDNAFNSGVASTLSLNLLAATGWDGNSFSGTRSAAPFSILDAINSAITLIVAEQPNAVFPALDAYWSPDNTNNSSGGQNIDTGEIGTTFYSSDQLFLLGADGVDIEEFDHHVIVHEWGHYFEDNFSRSDSIGGEHALGDHLDMRVAFGEGFATALSGIVLNDAQYCDALWSGSTLTGFGIDIESGGGGVAGWFNEVSILKFIYDLWDSNVDGADNANLGFTPIFDVMTGPQKTTPAFTSIFTFATYLKQQGTGQNAFIDLLLLEQNINPNGIDIYATNETNDGAGTRNDVLPVYTDLTPGVAETICANSQFDGGRAGNKLSEHRYLRLDIPAPMQVTLQMTTLDPPSVPSSPAYDCETAPDSDPETHQHSDPDFLLARDGQLEEIGLSCEPNVEVVTSSAVLAAGMYVIDMNEFRHEDEETPGGFPERVCFEFTAN